MILIALLGTLLAVVAAIGATVIMVALGASVILGVGGAIIKTIKDKIKEKNVKLPNE